MNLETTLNKQPLYAPPYHPAMRMDLPSAKPVSKMQEPKTDTIDKSCPSSYSEKILLELPGTIGYAMELGRFSAFEDAFHAAHGTGPSYNIMDTGMASALEGYTLVSMKEILKPLDVRMPEAEFKPITPKNVLIPLAENIHEHLVLDPDGTVTGHSHLTIGTRHEFYSGEGNNARTLNHTQLGIVNRRAEEDALRNLGVDPCAPCSIDAILGRKR